MAEKEHLLLEEIIQSDPSPEAAYLVLSRMKEKLRPELLIQRCRRALRKNPDHIGLRCLLAEAYTSSGLLARASEELSRMAGILGGMTEIHLTLAHACEEKGMTGEALRLLGIYLAFHPEDRDALELLSRLRSSEPVETDAASTFQAEEGLEEEEEEEEEELQDIAEIPEIATATLAELYLKQGELEAAVRTYRKVVQRNPEDEQARHRLNELEGRPREEEPPEFEAEANPERRRKERLIGVLEAWLSRIQEARSAAAP